ALGAGAIKFIEIRRVARRARAAKWWQTNPDDRDALALESSDRVVDAPRVDLFPFPTAKLGRAAIFFGTLRRGRALLGRIVGVSRLFTNLFFDFPLGLPVLGLRILRRLIFSLLLLGSCISLFGKILVANVLTVAEAQHHDDVVDLLLRYRIARDVPPVEIAFSVVVQQA